MSGPVLDPRYWYRSGSSWFQNQGPKGWFRWFPPKGGGTRNQLNRPLRSETRYRNQFAHSTPMPRPAQMPRPELPRTPGASHGLFQRDLTSPLTVACPGGAR